MRDKVLLTTEEVETLTGYVKPSAQSKWLSENGILHYVSGLNKVQVFEKSATSPSRPIKGPNWGSVA